MGNCIDRERAASWVDDYDEDWGSEESTSPVSYNNKCEHPKYSSSREGVPSTTEVKIKTTKKQLEKLLRNVDGKFPTVQELLADLMSSGNACIKEDAGRHWKPALQSIPEASE